MDQPMLAVYTLIYVEKLLVSLEAKIGICTGEHKSYFFTSYNAHR